MVKKAIILLDLYFFAVLPFMRGKNILPNLTNSQEPEPFFLAPWSRSRSKKKYQEPEPEPLGEKIRSRSRSLLKKSQEPEPLKNLPAPQPCSKVIVASAKNKEFVIAFDLFITCPTLEMWVLFQVLLSTMMVLLAMAVI